MKKELILDYPYEFSRLFGYLEQQARAGALKGLQFRRADIAAGRIILGVPFGLMTWGMTIEINLSSLGPALTRVRIMSRDDLPTVLIDFGKNSRNVRRVRECIEAAAPLLSQPLPR